MAFWNDDFAQRYPWMRIPYMKYCTAKTFLGRKKYPREFVEGGRQGGGGGGEIFIFMRGHFMHEKVIFMPRFYSRIKLFVRVQAVGFGNGI